MKEPFPCVVPYERNEIEIEADKFVVGCLECIRGLLGKTPIRGVSDGLRSRDL